MSEKSIPLTAFLEGGVGGTILWLQRMVPPTRKRKGEKKMVKKINAEQFESEAKKSAVAVVDFSATWCGPCRMLAPVVETISEKLAGKVDFYNVDVDDAPELAGEYRVNSVPCLVLMKNGEFVDQSIGFKPEAMITAWINENL